MHHFNSDIVYRAYCYLSLWEHTERFGLICEAQEPLRYSLGVPKPSIFYTKECGGRWRWKQMSKECFSKALHKTFK